MTGRQMCTLDLISNISNSACLQSGGRNMGHQPRFIYSGELSDAAAVKQASCRALVSAAVGNAEYL